MRNVSLVSIFANAFDGYNTCDAIITLSVKELTTKTQREEDIWLVHDILGDTILYINGLLQPYTPALPDPTQTLLYNEVAPIGYPDDITGWLPPQHRYRFLVT